MADLPASLAGAVDPGRGELVVRTTEVTAVLAALAGWAGAHGLDLAGLEVGAPSLEDAYLALVAEPFAAAASEEVRPMAEPTAYLTHAGGLVAAREAGGLKRWRATPPSPLGLPGRAVLRDRPAGPGLGGGHGAGRGARLSRPPERRGGPGPGRGPRAGRSPGPVSAPRSPR